MDDSFEVSPAIGALVALSDHGGRMTEAALAVGIPQSTMSRRIHALEEQLGVPLLVRHGRTVRLTVRAQELADLCRGPLIAVESAVDQISGSGDPATGVVRFGFPLTMGAGSVPDLLEGFSRRHPRIRLQLVQAHGRALNEDLRRGALDLAITIPPPVDLPHTLIAQQDIQAAVSDSHPLAVRDTIQLDELEGEPFIANPTSYHLRRVTEQWCREAGFVPQVTVEVTEFGTVREFVSRDLGVALLPPATHPIDHFVEVPLIGEYLRDVALTSPTERLTPATELLYEHVVEHFSR